MHIKTTMRCHITPVRGLPSISQQTSVRKDVEKGEPSGTLGGNGDWMKPLWKTVCSVFLTQQFYF